MARGLNTIAANITQNQDALAEYGISVEDANGNLKSTYDVLSELKSKWDDLKESERVALGVTLAGKNQYKVLASVMKNFSTATEATAAALNSSGSAARENARYMESIEARITAVKAAFQQMSTAVVDSDLVKGVLDVVKGMAEFGATDFGAGITQFVLLSGLSWGGLQLLGQSILPGIINSFKTFNALRAGTTLTELAAGGSALKVALSASLPYILAITAAIVGLVAVVKAVKKAYDEANPSMEQAALNMENAQESLKEAGDNYTEAKEKLDELNATKFEDRTSEIQAEIEKLQALKEYYEMLVEVRKQEAGEKTKQYVSTAEKQGFGAGTYTGQITRYSDYLDVAPSVENLAQSYHSLEAAVYAAAKAQYEFDGTIVDVSSVSAAQAQLEELGWTFKENTISIENAQSQLYGYLTQLQHGKELTPQMADGIQDLLTDTYEYADALQYLKDNGYELNSSQEEFLLTWESLRLKAIEVAESTDGVVNGNESVANSAAAAAASLGGYAQALLNAANAYETFKQRISESGDFDDPFKGMASLWSEINGEMEKGQYGSQAMLTALNLLTGQTFDYASAQEYLNQNFSTLNTLFGDAESGGLGLVAAMQSLNESGQLTGASIKEVNGGLEISVTDFAALADSLGISEGALYTLTEAARIFGIDFKYSIDDILANMGDLGEGIVSIEDGITHVDFAGFVSQMQEMGRSNDEIKQLYNVLKNTSDVQLDNAAAGLALLESPAEGDTEKVEGLNSALDEVAGFDGSSAISGLAGIGTAAAIAAGPVSTLASALKGLSLGSNAKGTSYAKEGLSLVNEEGPELIQSGNEAYIAGGGFPTVTQLHEGDIVYTAEETEDILDGKKINGVIQSHKGTINKTKTQTGITGGTATISSTLQNAVNKILNKNKGKGGSSSSSSSSSSSDKSSSSSSSSKDEYKAEFDEWLKAKKHALAMDEIAEEEYYNALKEMNDKYFKGRQEYQDEYWKYQEQIYSWEKKQIEEKAKAEAEAYKNEFDSWMDEQDHALAMDLISQEDYYASLEEMNDKYFKDKEEYQSEYWRYEEKIYAWRKRQAEEEAKAQEQALKDQIELEKKLNDLAKAKASKVKVFQDGQFRYVSDREALAKAQSALSSYADGTYSSNAGLSLVGEQGAELRVLNKGDGILPSYITKNLWGWGTLNPDFVLNRKSDSNNQNYNFDIDKLVLPDVNNAMGFVEGLKSFALQYSTQRG